MQKIIKKIWGAASGGSTLWGFLPTPWQAAFTAVISAMTGVVGYQGGGLFWALIGASAVFCFMTAGLYYAILLSRQTDEEYHARHLAYHRAWHAKRKARKAQLKPVEEEHVVSVSIPERVLKERD